MWGARQTRTPALPPDGFRRLGLFPGSRLIQPFDETFDPTIHDLRGVTKSAETRRNRKPLAGFCFHDRGNTLACLTIDSFRFH